MKSAQLFFAVVFGLAVEIRAEAPNLLTYQGRLKEAGSPVTGARQVQIHLCDAETAGTCAGTGEQPVAVTNALFRTTFTVPASVNLNLGSWWLEVRLGAGGTTILTPRERLSSAPYALAVSTAAGLLAPAGRNVGIGVAAPTASLHVSNPSATGADTVLKVSSGTGVGQELLSVKGDGALAVAVSTVIVKGTGMFFVPTGAVMMFDLAACPDGWRELTEARGRHLVGLPSGGTLKGTAGTALSNLENREVGQHSHSITDTGHAHGLATSIIAASVGGGSFNTYSSNTASNTGSNTTGILVNATGAVAGTNAPYIQLLVCRKD